MITENSTKMWFIYGISTLLELEPIILNNLDFNKELNAGNINESISLKLNNLKIFLAINLTIF